MLIEFNENFSKPSYEFSNSSPIGGSCYSIKDSWVFKIVLHKDQSLIVFTLDGKFYIRFKIQGV